MRKQQAKCEHPEGVSSDLAGGVSLRDEALHIFPKAPKGRHRESAFFRPFGALLNIGNAHRRLTPPANALPSLRDSAVRTSQKPVIRLMPAFALGLIFLALCPGRLTAQTAPTMPSVSDLLEVVDKATTDPTADTPNEWSAPVKLVVLFTLLAVLPSILAMTTSFTRIVIVLGFVRRALGTQTIPPNTAVMGLALFLTLFTMAPTFYRIQAEAIAPYLEDQIEFGQTTETASLILKEFMIRQTRTSDMALFVSMAKIPAPENVTDWACI